MLEMVVWKVLSMSADDVEVGPLILHASDSPEDVRRALRLSGEIIEDPACASEIHIVVNHSAIPGILDVSQSQIPQGVTVHACATAMRGHRIGRQDVPACVDIVPSGIVFIAQQQSGDAWYIRL